MSIGPLRRLAARLPAEPVRPASGTGQPGKPLSGAGDYRTLDIVAMFSAYGLYGRDMGGGKHAVQCPNAGAHSDQRRPEDSDTVIYEGTGGNFPGLHCMHAHCGHLDRFEELLKFFPDADRFCSQTWQPTRRPLLRLEETAPPPTEAPATRQQNSAEPAQVRPVRPAVTEPECDPDEEPLPILDGGVMPFPTDCLPYPVQQVIREGARSVNAPEDFVGVPALIAMASAIGNSRALQVKPNWVVRAVLWGVVVGKPGSAKTPAASIALAPVREKQRRLRDRHRANQELFKEDQREFDQSMEEWKRRMSSYAAGRGSAPGPLPEKPAEPEEKQVYTTNTTLEALNHLLYRMPRGVLVYQDEIAGFVAGMDAYRSSKGGDLQAWLEMWNSGTIVVNRRGEKTALYVESPAVSLTGSTQPDVIPDLLADRDRSDGFIDRFLFAWPDRLPPVYREEGVDGQTLETYQQLVNRLFDLEPAHEEPGICEPQVLHFAADGKRTWRRWSESHYAELRDPNFPPHFEGLWMKLFAYCARLALVVHCARFVWQETDSLDVDHRSVMAAAALTTYFKSHAQRVYLRLRASTEEQAAAVLMEWLQQRGGTATARDIYRNQVAGCRDASGARALMQFIALRGHAELTEGPRGKLSIFLRNSDLSTCPVGSVAPGAVGETNVSEVTRQDR